MNLTIYAYTIENDKLSKAHSDFAEKFIAKLKNSNAVKQRCYEVNSETREFDLLFKFMEVSKNVVYGIIARIKPTKDMPSLPNDFMERPSLDIKDLEGVSENRDKMSCSDIDYFVLNKAHLVTTIPSTRIARFKAFANYYLAAERGNSLYSIVSMVDMPKDVKLEDLTQIVFSGNGSSVSIPGGEEEKTTIIRMAKDKLTSLVNDSNIAFLLDKNILTANLVVKFNTKSKSYKSDTEVKKALSAIVTNMASDDGVQFVTKNRKRITAGSTKRCKTITIDTASDSLPNEESLRQEMVDYLTELNGLII